MLVPVKVALYTFQLEGEIHFILRNAVMAFKFLYHRSLNFLNG